MDLAHSGFSVESLACPTGEACSQICHGSSLTGPQAITPVTLDLLTSSCLVLARTMNFALRPWQTLGNSLGNQERPFQLPLVELHFCPTLDKCPHVFTSSALESGGAEALESRSRG